MKKLIVQDISTPAMRQWLASHDPIWDKKPQYLIDEANENAKKREQNDTTLVQRHKVAK